MARSGQNRTEDNNPRTDKHTFASAKLVRDGGANGEENHGATIVIDVVLVYLYT